MSIRSLNGLSTNNVRSLNGLEGIGIESIVGGDAIAITTATGSRTINVDISKQGATSSIADTDLFLLETSAGLIKKITGANLKSESDTNFWSRSGGFIQPLTQTDKLQLFSSITNDTDAGSTFFDILTFKNTTSSSALATFKYQINDTSSNTTSNAKFKMVHYDSNTDTTTDIYSVDTSSILTFSKRLTLTNGLKQGSFDYTMPSASGTLALQSELDDIWSRSSTNIQQTNTNDTLTLDYQADATYKDTLLIKNTNAGTDILTYKFQIKDNGSFDASLNFKVDYSRGGGTSEDIFDISYNGFLQVKKRLDVANGFFANSGEEYNFLSTGGTLANTNFFSGTSPISYNSSTGVISTTFTPSSVDTLTNKTFDSAVVPFNKGLSTKFDSNTTTSGFVRFIEATGQGSNYLDLHLEDNRIIDPVGTGLGNINVFLPTSVNDTVLVGRNTADTLTNKTITSFIGGSSATITTPSTTGTLALANATHTSKWNDSSNIYTPTNSSITSIDLPNNCAIRNAKDTTQFIKFLNTDSTNEVIQLASNMISVENKLIYSGNSAYYLQFGNGTLNSTFTQIHIPQNSYIINDSDTTNDWIQFKEDIFNINFAYVDFKENVRLRNASDPSNDFISLRNNHFYINYAITEIKETGKIANGSDPTNDYIQFNNDELYINYNNVLLKQGSNIKNASNSLSGFNFDSEGVIFQGPLKVVSEYTFPFPTRFPLEVEGYLSATDPGSGSALYYQNVPSLGGRAIAINGNVNMGIYTEYGLYCHTGTEIWVASDSRIKKDIEKFNSGLDLLRQLEVKSYCYIDGKGKNTKYKEIGFIAQEVKEIYPKAITQNHEYIPNVYKKIECIWTDFENKFKMKSNDLNNVDGVDYRFFCWNEGDKIETKVEAKGNSDNTFTFKKKWDNVFCIGNKVNDFNVLDKQQLFVINFNATQQLDNIVKQQQETINTLKNEVEILKEFMNELITSKSFADFKKKIS